MKPGNNTRKYKPTHFTWNDGEGSTLNLYTEGFVPCRSYFYRKTKNPSSKPPQRSNTTDCIMGGARKQTDMRTRMKLSTRAQRVLFARARSKSHLPSDVRRYSFRWQNNDVELLACHATADASTPRSTHVHSSHSSGDD